jgi:hypothetical protein
MRVSVFSPSAGRPLAAVALLAVLAAPAAAAPRDELLRFVPPDMAFCLVLQDLRSHANALAESPFVEQLRRSALGKAVAKAQEWSTLDTVEARLKKDLGVDWNRLRDDFLGDAVVIAYRPPTEEGKAGEGGLVLVRARDAKTLAELVDRINKLQQDKGEITELERLRHAGVTYYRREDARGSSHYYCLRGPVLIFSAQEAMLRRALDTDRAAPANVEPAVSRRLQEAGADKAVIALWVNPRALDAQVEAHATEGQDTDQEAAGRKAVAECWKALDDVVFGVHLERDLSVSLALRGRLQAMPAGVRRFLEESARPSELWKVFPENALLALALRVDGPALFDAVTDFLPPEAGRSLRADLNHILGAALGKEDFFKEVLPAVGPDGGLCITAPASGDKAWFPHVLLAVRVATGKRAAGIDQALLSALHIGAGLAVIAYNSEHRDRELRLLRTSIDDQDVRYLASDGALPGGLQPAFSLRGSYLVLASSLDVLRGFRAPEPGGTTPTSFPLLRISFKDWRTYLKDRRDDLAEALARREEIKRDEARRRLDGLADALQFVDRVELRQRCAPGLVVFTLSIRTAEPLKK